MPRSIVAGRRAAARRRTARRIAAMTRSGRVGRARTPAAGRSGSRPRRAGPGALTTRALVPAVALDRRARTAARIWRSMSSRGDRRGPRSGRVDGGDAVDVVGAVGDRHLRELRPVQRPVHLDERNRAAHQPRHRDRPHVVVAGRRRVGRIEARQRRERRSAPVSRCTIAARSMQVEPLGDRGARRSWRARRPARRAARRARPRRRCRCRQADRAAPRPRPRARPRAARAPARPAPDDRRRPAPSRSASENPVSGTPAGDARGLAHPRARLVDRRGRADQAHFAGLARPSAGARPGRTQHAAVRRRDRPSRALRASSPSSPTPTRSGDASTRSASRARQRRARPATMASNSLNAS